MRKQVTGSVHAVINHELAIHMAAVVASADDDLSEKARLWHS
jgi:hypothetical protein